MKRNGGEGTIDSLSMANCLMLLASGGGIETETMMTMDHSSGRTFECKTCNRKFPSFQALGGHRASHKKPRLMGLELGLGVDDTHQQAQQQMKPKTHECSICGLEFAIGQALGGHMRRHRAAVTGGGGANLSLLPPQPPPPTKTTSQVAVLKKSQSRRVFCLDLDLNLTPFENEIGLEFGLGKMSPVPSLIA
ncbi:zinc finger protein ZAT12-like [Macadamia integrifolia]|uniref:zinc finger protein ZAT12-like n=1 Tax=Macadamia integrifolia TaxID=60698 RepID=UPI001C4E4FD8|nr:zinc finger protein ZAT12-like [Macadamia integrifolia]